MSLRTVQRDLQSATFRGRKGRRDRGRSLLDPYKAALLERWNAGCYTAARLFRDLQQQGYPGSYARVAAYARRLRQAQGLPPAHRCPRQPLPPVAEPLCQPLTPRRATWLVLRHPEKRTDAETQQLTQLHAQSAELAEAIELAQDFATLVRQRQPEHLDPWLLRATTSAVDAVRCFANGLSEDYKAVKAGVTLRWSTEHVAYCTSSLVLRGFPVMDTTATAHGHRLRRDEQARPTVIITHPSNPATVIPMPDRLFGHYEACSDLCGGLHACVAQPRPPIL
jgi:transposase